MVCFFYNKKLFGKINDGAIFKNEHTIQDMKKPSNCSVFLYYLVGYLSGFCEVWNTE